MKKVICMCITAVLCLGLCVNAFAANDIMVNWQETELGKFSVMENESILADAELLLGALEAMSAYDKLNDVLYIYKVSNGINMSIKPDYDKMMIMGTWYDLDAPARMVNGRLYIPLRKTAEALGYRVEWDDETRSVHIHVPTEA